jgi:hypothetical protein
MDNEIKGVGNSINYKYRMHDPRLGRFFAVDPLAGKYPFYSPYAFSGNRVNDAVELEGKEPVHYQDPYTVWKMNQVFTGEISPKEGAKSCLLSSSAYGAGFLSGIGGMLASPLVATEFSLLTSTSWGSLPLVESYIAGAASTTALSRGLAFTSDAGGQWVYQSAQNDWNFGVGFSKISWTSPSLDLINPSANILNGFFSSTFRNSIESGWNIGKPNEIISGTVSQFAFGSLTTSIKTSWINSISYEKQLVNTLFENGLFQSGQKQAINYGVLRYGIGSGINIGMDAAKVFWGEELNNNIDKKVVDNNDNTMEGGYGVE